MLVEGLVSRRWTAAAIWASLAAGGAYLYWFEPGKTGFFPSCPFRALTGFNCPGCGTTRAVHQLLHGHVVAAFEINPLTILLLPVLAYALVSFTKSANTGRPVHHAIVWQVRRTASLIVVFGFWVFRNTPLYPFSS